MNENIEIKKKVEELLTDEDTQQWINTIRSESAKINYQKHLAEYLVYRNLTIKQLINNFGGDDQIEEAKKVQEFVNFLQNTPRPHKPLEASSVGNYVSAIKSRMNYEGIQIVRKITIHDRHFHRTVAEETTPTASLRLTLPSRAALTSVPRSAMPVSKRSCRM